MGALNFLRCALKIQFNEHLRDTLAFSQDIVLVLLQRRHVSGHCDYVYVMLAASQPASERASRKKGCHKHILFNVIAFLRSAAVPAAPPDDDAAI